MKGAASGVGLLLALGWVASCTVAEGERTGGETHFLSLCDKNVQCGNELSCLGGVCTKPCDLDVDCSALPGAGCSQSTVPSQTPVCEVACSSSDDCEVVSEGHQCSDGVCRAGTGDAAASSCARGEVRGNELLVIGDSFFGATHQVTGFLENLARNSGALDVGERYRDNSAVTGNALALGGRGIASQYDAAVAEAPVQVVIMNGGGTDALLGSCETADTECPLVVAADLAVAELLAQMSDDGVGDVVYVFYPDYEDDSIRAELDVLRVRLEDTCRNSPVPCHLLDLRPVFEGRLSDYIDTSGVLPSELGAEATLQAIWALMQAECIAQ